MVSSLTKFVWFKLGEGYCRSNDGITAPFNPTIIIRISEPNIQPVFVNIQHVDLVLTMLYVVDHIS